jgi:tRNA(Ile)-lysidine synthase
MIKESDFQNNWSWLKSKKLFLACSGGVDSMVLLHLIVKAEFRVSILHVNYHLRGEDSNSDAQFVKSTCEKLKLPFYSKSVDTKKLLNEQGGNLQDVARKIRYDWFGEIRNNEADNFILLAHHNDDQVETFFQHIARKSGVIGLAGMLENHNQILRPLLNYSKEEIVEFAKINEISWREDVSNLKNEYTRNKLRNILLPIIVNHIPTLKDSVLTLVKAFQETQQKLELKVNPIILNILETQKWSHENFDQLSEFEQVEVLRNLGIRQTAISELQKLRKSQKGKRIQFDGFEIFQDSNSFILNKIESENLLNVKWKVQKKEVENLPLEFNLHEIFLDQNTIKGDLVLRKWEIGDKMKPIGMKGSRLISDILKDAKLNQIEKKNILVLTDDEKVLWCVGLKISKEGIANSESKKIIKVWLENSEESNQKAKINS